MNKALNLEEAVTRLTALNEPPAEESANDAIEAAEDVSTGDLEGEPTGDPEPREEEAETPADEISLDAEQVASILGIDPENIIVNDDGELRFRTKVDGEEGDATLKDALERYQRDANLTNRSKALADQKKKVDETLNDLLQRSQHMAQQQELVFQELEAEMLKPFKEIDWSALRADDPAEYAARREDMSSAQRTLQTLYQNAQKAVAEQWQHSQKVMQEKLQEHIKEQSDLVKSYIPAWNESTQKEVRSFLISEGFSDKEVGAVSDARLVKLAHMAMMFKNGKENVTKSLSKKPLPKVLKPGAKPSTKEADLDSVKKAHQKLKATGKMEDAVSLLRMKVRS